MTNATVMAGIPAKNNALYHRLRFSVGDPAALISLGNGDAAAKQVLILRDIEMDRARRDAQVDAVHCPADFAPEAGLSGDRETATAQSLAEFLVQSNVEEVTTDRTLPLIYLHHMQERGIDVQCDLDLGVIQRRSKDEQEIEWLAAAQAVTESAMELACRLVAKANANLDGVLQHEGADLTSERVRHAIDVFLLQHGYSNPSSIVAGGPQGADCHELGSGVLQTGQPVIIDIFPQNRKTKYNGDCTRTVVHGTVDDTIAKMHAAVLEAKRDAIAVCKAGVTGEQVHAATAATIQKHGYEMGLPSADADPSYCAMVHGTGHGIGLDVHESPLLDKGGPALVLGDAITVEPGLYSHAVGGIRIEDMVIVQQAGCRNLNQLPEGLSWD